MLSGIMMKLVRSRNQSNFLLLIKLLVSYIDEDANIVLENAPYNWKYVSHQIHKEHLFNKNSYSSLKIGWDKSFTDMTSFVKNMILKFLISIIFIQQYPYGHLKQKKKVRNLLILNLKKMCS